MKFYRWILSAICLSLTPLVHASPALTLDDFLADPTLLSAELSPSGKRVATVWNHGFRRDVRVFDLSTNSLISNVGDNIVRAYSVDWADEDTLLIKKQMPVDADESREEWEKDGPVEIPVENLRLFSADIHGDNQVQLINDDFVAQKTFNLTRISNLLRDDKDHILMEGWRRRFLSQFKVNIRTGKSEVVAKGYRYTIGFINDENGDLLYRYDYKPVANRVEIFRYDNEGEWSLAREIYFDEDDESQNEIEIDDLVGVYKDQLVYRKRNDDTGFYELLLHDEKTGGSTPLVSFPDKDVVGVISSRWGGDIIGYRTLEDLYRSHFFEDGVQQAYEKLASHFPDESFQIVSRSQDADKLLIKAWGQRNPISYHLYDASASTFTLFSYPYHTLPPEKLGYGIATQYPARDGQRIKAYVVFPPNYDGSTPLPTIVMPHGGPHARDYARYDDFAQFLATRGFIVIKPNFRGSTGYGLAFEEAGYKQWGGVMQDDVEDAGRFLIREKLADPDRLCIVGSSYGGYAAMMGVVKTPDFYRCAVSINGISHLPEQVDYALELFRNKQSRQLIKERIGDPDTDEAMLESHSPALNASKVKVPVLLIAGEDDSRVPVAQSELMHEALSEENKPVTFVEIEEMGHSMFADPRHQRQIYTEVARFLRLHLMKQADNASEQSGGPSH